MARTRGKNSDLFGPNSVRDQNLARQNFRQRANAAGANFLSSQLLDTGNIGLDYKIK